jgi:hypothetical protein
MGLQDHQDFSRCVFTNNRYFPVKFHLVTVREYCSLKSISNAQT